ncbi:hypothetical protein GLOTRDRAFT_69355 [Gloeophyllum trabeum ATCC 11539]|uniref:Thioredoxin-like fold domain-containing protein n=1 Tax=Gloeophyllum trabeum (strain ATCC 11539 / FP-39264 / Madison 617) TaxID=670483 RepID=S7S145_GLOTA|nr:uncharacterized protein GLOTRDRAFT_69355 [Gloeophyllum trabeum ATCC 11539]EPQ61125.1 hypothetical protein GLOTRDRAFT_69355 [Gloeophyllum trabeum ATCC 11539]
MPETIKVHAFPLTEPNAPSSSGFCQKLDSYLRATSIPYENVPSYPFSAPKGKLPYITTPKGEVIPDSHFIIQHLKASGVSKDLDAELTPAQKGDSRAWQGWLEEVVYPCMVYERWVDDAGYAQTAAGFNTIPWPFRAIVPWYFRRRITGRLKAQGTGQHSLEEVHTLEKEFVDALDAKFSDGREYFHQTATPTEVDVFIYGFLVNGLSQRSNAYFNKLVLGKVAIKGFVRRMLERLHPEYEGIRKMLNE